MSVPQGDGHDPRRNPDSTPRRLRRTRCPHQFRSAPVMSPLVRRRGAAIMLAAALAAAAGCSSASGEPDTTTATASPAATTAAGGDVQAACIAEITLNALGFPGADPEDPAPTAQKLQDFAADAEPLAATLRANVPAELINEIDVLDSVLATARRGQPVD